MSTAVGPRYEGGTGTIYGVKTRKGAHLSVRARSCTVHVGEVVREGKPYDLALRVRLLVEAFTGKDPGVGRWR